MRSESRNTRLLTWGAALAAMVWAWPSGTARAATDTVTLQSLNSNAVINYDGPNGVDNWTVDGVNQLAQEWFWFRVGSSGGQSSLDTLNLVGTPVPVDSNGGGTPNFVSTNYKTAPAAANPFKVTVTYNLTGSQDGSGTSDLAESIKITNTGTSNLTLHFFEYTNFDLGGTPGGDSVQIIGGNGSNIAGNTATQVDAATLAASTTVVAPRPGEAQIGGLAPYPNLLNELQTVNGLTLNNALSSATNTDASWAFEWDITLTPSSTPFLITVDKELHYVPEPTGIAVVGSGIVFLFVRPRRRELKGLRL